VPTWGGAVVGDDVKKSEIAIFTTSGGKCFFFFFFFFFFLFCWQRIALQEGVFPLTLTGACTPRPPAESVFFRRVGWGLKRSGRPSNFGKISERRNFRHEWGNALFDPQSRLAVYFYRPIIGFRTRPKTFVHVVYLLFLFFFLCDILVWYDIFLFIIWSLTYISSLVSSPHWHSSRALFICLSVYFILLFFLFVLCINFNVFFVLFFFVFVIFFF